MAELFGFKFERIKDTKGSEKFTAPSLDDGTVDVAGGGFYGQILDVEGRERTENDLIRRYRDISQQPECDSAIEDIVNEGIVSDERDQSVEIVLDRLPQPKRIKDKSKKSLIMSCDCWTLMSRVMISFVGGMLMVDYSIIK